MPVREGEVQSGARLPGPEQSPVLGPGFQSGKIIFTFVFAVFPELKSCGRCGFGSRTGENPTICRSVLQRDQKVKMAGNSVTRSDLFLPPPVHCC